MTSSPLRPGATLEDELDYYKKQYEQLETDLADFQASSKELEEQLERDIDASEKRERKLKETVEKLTFEVQEWKEKHKQSKAEANSAQNALQKEVTGMREGMRTLQLKLRDVEVVNDDYERQARNTEMSLEELESKYNVAIERDVMLEEEIKVGEQEREGLRIETQRLRDELGDLKVESEITLEKLRLADETIDRLRSRKPSPLAVENLRARSPAGSEASGITPSSPTASTPPPKSDSMSDAPTPPSPPLSDAPATAKIEAKTPVPDKRRSLLPSDAAATPRPSLHGPRAAPKHTRGLSVASSNGTSASDAKAMRPPASRPTKRVSGAAEGLPRSDSLYQIKALRGRMQKIEERVHSARSKLPPPGTRTPTGSPRTASALSGEHIPASVTMRRSIKRPSGSTASSLANDITPNCDSTHDDHRQQDASKRRESHIKRLSYGIPRPPSSAAGERPPSAMGMDRPPSAAAGRPMSRASASFARPSSRAGTGRPESRAGARTPLESTPRASNTVNGVGSSARPGSRAGARTPLESTPRTSGTLGRPSSRAGAQTPQGGQYGAGAAAAFSPRASVGAGGPARPRSSMGGGHYATVHGTPRSHRPSASVSELRRVAAESEDSIFAAPGTSSRRMTLEKGTAFGGTASRRTTLDRTGLPTLSGPVGRQGIGAQQQQQQPARTLRRTSKSGLGSSGDGVGEMRPPPSRRKMSDVGETY